MSKNIIARRLFTVFMATALVGMLFILPPKDAQALCSTQAECQAELDKINAEINKINSNIIKKDGEIKTISGEINELTGEINKTAGEIKKKDTLIGNLRSDIVRKENSLVSLNQKLATEKLSLEQILRKRNQLDDATLFELVLSSKDISEFYEDAPSFAYVQDSLSDSFKIIDDLRVNIYHEKSALEQKKEQENDVKYSLVLEKNKIEGQKSDRDQALHVSKSDKASYEELKKQREKEAQEIRAKMIQFQGSGITGKSISFGEAYDYAKFASSKTGVRTAFIMAIMQQESGFGRNVGGCYLKDADTGDGIYISTGNKSIRNMVPGNFDNFKKITTALGRDWSTTPISCVAYSGGSAYGYGGAMGYTQFIPNTWMSVEARVRSYLGASVANPWNAQHAVMATAVFTKDLGAAAQTYSAEYNAACRYYGSCSIYAYGTNVMNKAANLQKEIDKLERE